MNKDYLKKLCQWMLAAFILLWATFAIAFFVMK